MGTAEKVPDGRSKEHFVGEERLQVRCLFEPLVPGDACAAFGAQEEGYLLLREAGALPMLADIVWES